MTEEDSFYDKLPYTLEENQIHPDFLIFGTGLQETLIAAYRAKMQGKIGLIIDTEKTYGSSLKTLTFKEFNLLVTKKNKQKMFEFITPEQYLQPNQHFFNQSLESKKHRGYSIDIEPSFFLGSSITCECLKQADMDKYMDFHLVKSMFQIQNNQIKAVPLSKGKIFQSNALSLLEKKHLLSSLHKLMKIYQKFMNVELDMNSTQQFDKDLVTIDQTLYNQFLANLEAPFLPFIQKLVKKNKKIMAFLSYIICNYQYNYEKPIPQHARKAYTLKSFIEKFGKFIKSCGVYGEIPYLYVDSGIGDIPQAFSRIASIYASIYILHPKVEITSITKTNTDTFQIQCNLSPQKPIVAKQLFYGPTHLDLRKVQMQFHEQKILRVFVLTKKSGKEEPCPSICFITELEDFANPVYMFQFDNSSHSCPNDLIFYQFETIVANEGVEDCQQKAQKLVNVLQSLYGQQFRESIKYYAVYLRTRRYPKNENENQSDGVGLNDTMGIDLDQHFQNFISIVGKQENYFKKDNPNQQEEESFGDETKYILEKMDMLNLKQEEPKGKSSLPEENKEGEEEKEEKEEEGPKQPEEEIKAENTQNKQEQQKQIEQSAPEEKGNPSIPSAQNKQQENVTAEVEKSLE